MKAEMKGMSVGSLFDNAFRMSFGKFKEVLLVTFLFFLFLAAVSVFIAALVFGFNGWGRLFRSDLLSRGFWISLADHVMEKISFGTLIIFSALIIVITITADIIYNGILNHLFIRTFLGEDWKLKTSIETVWKKTGSLLFSLIPMAGISIAFIIGSAVFIGGIIALMTSARALAGMFFLTIFAGFIGIMIFLIYGIVSFQMVSPIIIGENSTGGKAVTRAFKLANYNILGVSGTYLLYLIMGMIISGIFGSVFGFLMGFLSGNKGLTTAVTVIYLVFYVLLTLFIGAIGRALIVTILYNLKIKNEGFGVESMVQDYIESPEEQEIDEK
jgi:hypothetical protein